MLRRLNPFQSLPHPRQVWAWGMYDLANQSFTLLINTLLFAVYLKEVVVGDDARGDRLWGAMGAVSMLIAVALSPIAGAIADARGLRKRMLVATGLLCASLTCAFGLVGEGAWALALLLYIPANVAYQLGENFLAAFLPVVAPARSIGRVSAIGWTMGYIGALVMLVVVIVANLGLGMKETAQWRPLLVFAGVWFLLAMIPAMVVLPEPAPDATAPRAAIAEAIARLRSTLAEARRYRQLARFLLAFFLYGMGVQTVIFFAGILAKETVFAGDPDANFKLFIFVLQTTVTAGVASAASGFMLGRLGARVTVLIFLGVWIATALGVTLLVVAPGAPEWLFWVVGNGVGLGLGGIGSSSRALFGRFTPRHRTAEFFGLWGMVYKLAAVVGLLAFSQVKASLGDGAGLALLLAFFIAGAIMLLRVNESAGVLAAKRVERIADRPAPPAPAAPKALSALEP